MDGSDNEVTKYDPKNKKSSDLLEHTIGEDEQLIGFYGTIGNYFF